MGMCTIRSITRVEFRAVRRVVQMGLVLSVILDLLLYQPVIYHALAMVTLIVMVTVSVIVATVASTVRTYVLPTANAAPRTMKMSVHHVLVNASGPGVTTATATSIPSTTA